MPLCLYLKLVRNICQLYLKLKIEKNILEDNVVVEMFLIF